LLPHMHCGECWQQFDCQPCYHQTLQHFTHSYPSNIHTLSNIQPSHTARAVPVEQQLIAAAATCQRMRLHMQLGASPCTFTICHTAC
jgi:hypothetical protein